MLTNEIQLFGKKKQNENTSFTNKMAKIKRGKGKETKHKVNKGY